MPPPQRQEMPGACRKAIGVCNVPGRPVHCHAGPGEEDAGSGIQYLLNRTSCGERSETHTVREWLQSFGIPLEDRFFLKWQEVVYEAGEAFRKAEIRADAREMETFWQTATVMLYLSYDMEKEFLPQFEANAQRLLEMLRKAVPQG